MPTPPACQPLESKHNGLVSQINHLNTILKGPDGKPDPEILGEKNALQKQADAIDKQLQACLIANAPAPAAATTPIGIAVTELDCIHDTDEAFNDEPYVVVLAVDLRPDVPGRTLASVPKLALTLSGAWSTTGGDVRGTAPLPVGVADGAFDAIPGIVWRRHCWGLTGTPQPIAQPADVMILVAVMENDDAKLSSVRGLATSSLTGSLAGKLNIAGMTRATLVSQMRSAMDDVLPAVAFAFPSGDDEVGTTKELALTPAELAKARVSTVRKQLDFGTASGGDGRGTYRVFLELSPH
jgi:hypothetical protein